MTYQGLACKSGDGWTIRLLTDKKYLAVSGERSVTSAVRKMTSLLKEEGHDGTFDCQLYDTELRQLVAEAEQFRAMARTTVMQADKKVRTAARALCAEMTVRDAAMWLGLSHSYVARLVSDD